MNKRIVSYISIPNKTWNTWTSVRPLKNLANDALATERRIAGKKNIDIDRVIYLQQVSYIESLGFQAVSDGRGKVLCSIDQDQLLLILKIARNISLPSNSNYRYGNILNCSFFSPDNISEYLTVLSEIEAIQKQNSQVTLKLLDINCMNSSLSSDKYETIEQLLSKTIETLSQVFNYAKNKQCGILTIIRIETKTGQKIDYK